MTGNLLEAATWVTEHIKASAVCDKNLNEKERQKKSEIIYLLYHVLMISEVYMLYEG